MGDVEVFDIVLQEQLGRLLSEERVRHGCFHVNEGQRPGDMEGPEAPCSNPAGWNLAGSDAALVEVVGDEGPLRRCLGSKSGQSLGVGPGGFRGPVEHTGAGNVESVPCPNVESIDGVQTGEAQRRVRALDSAEQVRRFDGRWLSQH
ncbi:hypothetical protein [Herbiconiux sp. VKM Ac-1786]|uniref:hypothetical protein n=1 Tax=Herbiconiux sp. VKM Ac-1786 TaxID=2783824 RepID=UPI001E33CA49|nr:hypothetical protein [Herbiconiux sp. VKM Ac-1786]